MEQNLDDISDLISQGDKKKVVKLKMAWRILFFFSLIFLKGPCKDRIKPSILWHKSSLKFHNMHMLQCFGIILFKVLFK